MTIFLFLLLFALEPQQLDAFHGEILCSTKISEGNIHDVTCQDFRSPDEGGKKQIDCCELHFSGSFFMWGANCYPEEQTKTINIIEAREPTATTCSIKFSLYEKFLQKFRSLSSVNKGTYLFHLKYLQYIFKSVKIYLFIHL